MADDDDDLDEYDVDAFLRERLNTAAFRRDWSRKRAREISHHHERAQLLTLSYSYSVSAVHRFREHFFENCRKTAEEVDAQLLAKFVAGHATDLLALARDKLMTMYLADNGSAAAAAKLGDVPQEASPDVVDAILRGEPIPDPGVTVTVHDATGVKPGASGSDKDVRDAMRVSLAKPKTMPGPQTPDEIDELAAHLYALSPWMREVVDCWRSEMLDSLEERGFAQLPPTLMVGPHGCGKTFLAEEAARAMGRPWKRLEGSTMTSAFQVSGGDFLWRHSHACEPVRMIAETGSANPVVIFDEVEKVSPSSGGDARKAMLPLLQRSTASSYPEPYLQAKVDLSHVDWILLANDLEGLPAPLLDRVHVFRVSYPQGEDLYRTVARALAKEAVGEEVIKAVVAGIEAGNLSLRGIDRIKARFRAINRRPIIN